MHELNQTKRGEYLLVGPYDEALWLQIRDMPDSLRAWSKRLTAWHIHPDGRQQAQQIIEDHYLVDDPMGRQMMERIRALEALVEYHRSLMAKLCADLGVTAE